MGRLTTVPQMLGCYGQLAHVNEQAIPRKI
jgi:hypothetical protein